ncbi:steroid 21-hydroxylase isoform X1 [Tympanuchus pallidicinctus]|uniref:steroid 21-hydroxylase isoform X1 n=1 Tax=Tympanuchus pallidicinctus TaxID=109042 RepID=UPI002286F7E0|nr:steroid 21-hydroxylase isoform X1 [Tympanuchus pallidicinctus]XP_052525921.1 steroid 21-hydroxylase isoform X1 [Tympanuchus pallidicinctus]
MAVVMLLLLFLLALIWGGSARWGGAPWGGALHLLHPGGPQHLHILTRTYGDPLCLRLGGREVVVLSSAAAIREALARRWGDFVGRPHSYLASLVSRGGQDLALGDASPEWRRQRGATRGALARAVRHLEPLLELQGWALCQELSSYGAAPVDLFEAFAFHTCSTICRLAFGDLMPPEAEVRSFTRCVVELLEVWGWASVRALDVLPPLRVLPNPGLRELLRLVERRDAFVETQIRCHQVGMWGHGDRGGTRLQGVTHVSLQGCTSPPRDTVLGALLGGDPTVPMGPLGGDRLHMALVDLFIGGTETTAAALLWAVAFLLHHPQVQDRVRAELHQVLGPTGTPKPGDMGRLPLLRATVTETLRLRPPAPLALPHCARRHSSIAGIPVPAGSIVIPNLFAAHHDPKIWDRPAEFLPERFLQPGAPWRALLPFGCGARSCVGEALARAELFVFLGYILQRFRLEPPSDGALPNLGVTAGTVLRCAPFRVRLVPCPPHSS